MDYEFIGRQDIPLEAVMPGYAQHVTELAVGSILVATLVWGLIKPVTRKDAFEEKRKLSLGFDASPIYCGESSNGGNVKYCCHSNNGI